MKRFFACFAEQATDQRSHSDAVVISAGGGRRSHDRGRKQGHNGSPAAPEEPSDSEDYMDLPTYVSLIGEQSRSKEEGPVPSPTKVKKIKL